MTAIAVLGAGNVGATLARRWTAAGHRVTLGSRTPDAPRCVTSPRASEPRLPATSTPSRVPTWSWSPFPVTPSPPWRSRSVPLSTARS